MDNLFATALSQARGNIAVRSSEELRKLLEAVMATGKKGTITIKLTVNPEEGDDQAVKISADIKTTIPQLPAPDSIFFVTSDFGLARTDPRQAEMQLEREKSGVTSLGDRRAGVSGDMIAAG